MPHERHAAKERARFAAGVIVHEQAVGVCLSLLIMDKAAHKAARPAEIFVWNQVCGGDIFRSKGLPVVDHGYVDEVVIEGMRGNGLAQPGHGRLDSFLAAEGGDADAKAHGLGFRGIRQVSSAVQDALPFGMNAQADDAGIGISAERQFQCGPSVGFHFP